MTEERPIVPGAEMTHETVHGDGVDLHVASAGPEDGDPVVLLHGFPDFWFGWRHQIPALVEAGHKVYVPDRRGVNESDAPDGLSLYSLDDLAADALTVMNHASEEPVAVVGHDWGGAVAWWVATEFPERVDRVVAVNASHPVAMERRVFRDPLQTLRSAYMGLFQVPEVPERLLSGADWRLMTAVLTSGSREGAFDDAELYDYRQTWSRTGAESLLAPYRAAVRERPEPPEPHVAPPAAIFWGLDDPALSDALAADTADLCEDARTVRFTGAGHWVHREAPEMVNDLLVRFLGGESLREDDPGTTPTATADPLGERDDAGTSDDGDDAGEVTDDDGGVEIEVGDDDGEADAAVGDDGEEAGGEASEDAGEETEADATESEFEFEEPADADGGSEGDDGDGQSGSKADDGSDSEAETGDGGNGDRGATESADAGETGDEETPTTGE